MRLYQRDPIYICWRIAAIHRCVLRHGKSMDWALGKVRELCPEGHRDALVRSWFIDIDRIRRPHLEEPENASVASMAAA